MPWGPVLKELAASQTLLTSLSGFDVVSNYLIDDQWFLWNSSWRFLLIWSWVDLHKTLVVNPNILSIYFLGTWKADGAVIPGCTCSVVIYLWFLWNSSCFLFMSCSTKNTGLWYNHLLTCTSSRSFRGLWKWLQSPLVFVEQLMVLFISWVVLQRTQALKNAP